MMGLSFGVLISILANRLSDQWTRYIPGLIALLIVSIIVTLVLAMREPFNLVKVAIRAPITIHDELDARQYARPGFVGFVPYYTPRWNSAASKLSPEARQKESVAEFNLWSTRRGSSISVMVNWGLLRWLGAV
jgi:hypothetical protein